MKKGFTLIEVLVSMFIFALVFSLSLSTYLISVTLEKWHSEYIFFEGVCLDINEYSNVYLKEWNVNYFGNESNTQYYTSQFKHVDEVDTYELSFIYNEKNELIINIKEYKSSRYIIKDLNYGGSRYA